MEVLNAHPPYNRDPDPAAAHRPSGARWRGSLDLDSFDPETLYALGSLNDLLVDFVEIEGRRPGAVLAGTAGAGVWAALWD